MLDDCDYLKSSREEPWLSAQFALQSYTAIWNLLQYPAVAMPAAKLVGHATPAELRDEYVPKNELEKHYWEIYSADDAEGLPVGVQVVGKRYHERMVLQAARLIEKALLGK